MLPEQVWDTAPIPSRGLALGRPTGGAMPLAWAHAEYIKLVISRALKRPVDRPACIWKRYRGQRPLLTRVMWCEHAPATELPAGCALTLALRAAGAFRVSIDGQDAREQSTTPNSLGLHVCELDTRQLRAGQALAVTFRHAAAGDWSAPARPVRVTAAKSGAG
jgi:glucoamylase